MTKKPWIGAASNRILFLVWLLYSGIGFCLSANRSQAITPDLGQMIDDIRRVEASGGEYGAQGWVHEFLRQQPQKINDISPEAVKAALLELLPGVLAKGDFTEPETPLFKNNLEIEKSVAAKAKAIKNDERLKMKTLLLFARWRPSAIYAPALKKLIESPQAAISIRQEAVFILGVVDPDSRSYLEQMAFVDNNGFAWEKQRHRAKPERKRPVVDATEAVYRQRDKLQATSIRALCFQEDTASSAKLYRQLEQSGRSYSGTETGSVIGEIKVSDIDINSWIESKPSFDEKMRILLERDGLRRRDPSFPYYPDDSPLYIYARRKFAQWLTDNPQQWVAAVRSYASENPDFGPVGSALMLREFQVPLSESEKAILDDTYPRLKNAGLR